MSVALPFRWTQTRARVASQRDVGAGFRWLELETPEDFGTPEPGQFVQLLLPPPAVVLLPRPMSVAAVSRRRGRLTVGFLYAPVGTGTRALAELEAGETVEVLGPLGRGFPLDHPGTPLLIAGGRGVAPLLFAAHALERRRCEFIFGARSKSQLVGLADAESGIARAGGRLHLCTDDGSRGFRGNVVELLDRLAPRFAPPLVIHACGPHAMLRSVALWGMQHRVPSFLAMESVMACGTGVCRGCPLPRSESGSTWVTRQGADFPSLYGNREYAMCCTEGPVFAAGELDWERIE